MTIEYQRPTASSTTVNVGATGQFMPNYAYDSSGSYPETTNFASQSAAGNFTSNDAYITETYTTFTKTNTWASYVIKFKGYGIVNTIYSGTEGYTIVEYSTDGGTGWTTLAGGASYATYYSNSTYSSGTISGNPTIGNIKVRVTAHSYGSGGRPGGDEVVTVTYDIWIEGTVPVVPIINSISPTSMRLSQTSGTIALSSSGAGASTVTAVKIHTAAGDTNVASFSVGGSEWSVNYTMPSSLAYYATASIFCVNAAGNSNGATITLVRPSIASIVPNSANPGAPIVITGVTDTVETGVSYITFHTKSGGAPYQWVSYGFTRTGAVFTGIVPTDMRPGDVDFCTISNNNNEFDVTKPFSSPSYSQKSSTASS